MSKKRIVSGVVLYYKKDGEVFILLGYTGRFLSDRKDDKDEIKMLEKSTTFENVLEHIEKLEQKYKKPIQYIEEKEYINEYYKSNFVFLEKTNRSSISIPKGGVEQKEEDDDAAIREVKEEVGIDLLKEKLKELERYFYCYKLDEKEIKTIYKCIDEFKKQKTGELFDTQFVNIKDNLKGTYNNFTKSCLQSFKSKVSLLNPNAKEFIFTPKV
jgi:hypothetical protein